MGRNVLFPKPLKRMVNMKLSRDEDLLAAWDAMDGEKEQQALNLAMPWALKGDWDACTVCALAYLYLGESDLCDQWTIKAGDNGARDNWLSQQSDFEDFAILVCRYDTLTTLGTEGLTPLDAQLALHRYLIDGSLELALFYSIKAIRLLWDSSLVNKNIDSFASHISVWIFASKFESQEIDTILQNLLTSAAGALSFREAQAIVATILESLEKTH